MCSLEHFSSLKFHEQIYEFIICIQLRKIFKIKLRKINKKTVYMYYQIFKILIPTEKKSYV